VHSATGKAVGTMKLKIGIGTDHRGFAYKEVVKLDVSWGDFAIEWHDVGAYSDERTDYPIYAHKAVQALQKKEIQYAVLLCGSGVGMAIAANRFPNIYAAVAWNSDVARAAKADDNVNVLCIPADYVTLEQTREIIQAWLAASFKGGRYQRRLEMIDPACAKAPAGK